MSRKFAAYDANGKIIAFYDRIDSPVPASVENSVEITQAQWQTCISQPGQWLIVNGALAQVPPPTAAQQLAAAQDAQNATLNAGCAAAIVVGFSSNAIGASCSYPSTLTDQANLNTVAQCSSGGLLWCTTGGAWSFRPHTQVQAQGVVASFATWLNKCQQQLVTLSGQVNAATTVAAVQAIGWTDPA